MGTMREWLIVAFNCVLWGGWMLAWETRKRKAANLEPGLLPASILIWILGGLGFGLFVTFKWRAFQLPLIFVTIASFGVGSVIALLYRSERSKAFNQRTSWQRTVALFLLLVGLPLLLVDRARPIAYLSFVAIGVFFLLDAGAAAKSR